MSARTPNTFEGLRAVHFVGIGGIGISAIARMLLLRGVSVSGSDRSASRVTEELVAAGAHVDIGHSAGNVSPQAELLVYTIAAPEDNPERAEARRRGIPELSYPEALGILTRMHRTICVCGTHGKTTTTAMIGGMLSDLNCDPTVVVGSLLSSTGSNFVSGTGPYLVCEACEYRRSFLKLSPEIIVITNIEADHLDYYSDLDDIVSAFREFVGKLPPHGTVIAPVTDATVRRVLEGFGGRVIDYAEEELTKPLKVPGAHNRENAKAALALARVLSLERTRAEDSLANFAGTWRRFEYRGRTTGGALVLQYPPPPPSEVRATLLAAREAFPNKKITVFFQPHLYSRTKDFLTEFASALSVADTVLIAPIYAAREEPDESISSSLLAREVDILQHNVRVVTSLSEGVDILKHECGEADVVITMGAGDVGSVADSLGVIL